MPVSIVLVFCLSVNIAVCQKFTPEADGKMEMKTIKIGEIGVDAGLCWVGDPCYIMHCEGGKMPKELGKNWEEFCSNIEKMDRYKQFNYDAGHAGLGVLVSTGYGDGVYPVFAKIADEGRVKEITIKFF